MTKKTEGTKVTAYEYSSEGALLKVTLPDGKIIDYLYDANGNRTTKKVDGTTTEKYLWDGITLLAVYDGNDNLKMRFEYTEDLGATTMVKD